MKQWSSNAEWVNLGITTDYHETETQAKAVCRTLEKEGLGGDCIVFPIRTWVSKIDKGE